jgi:hypothetical protein
MELSVTYRDVDLTKFEDLLHEFNSQGTIDLSKIPLSSEHLSLKSESIRITDDCVHILDEHGNTDQLFQFWESISIMKLR